MRYSKLLRFPIVLIILLVHGINPFIRFGNMLPKIKSRLSVREKEYIINTCLHTKSADLMRKMIYG